MSETEHSREITLSPRLTRAGVEAALHNLGYKAVNISDWAQKGHTQVVQLSGDSDETVEAAAASLRRYLSS